MIFFTDYSKNKLAIDTLREHYTTHKIPNTLHKLPLINKVSFTWLDVQGLWDTDPDIETKSKAYVNDLATSTQLGWKSRFRHLKGLHGIVVLGYMIHGLNRSTEGLLFRKASNAGPVFVQYNENEGYIFSHSLYPGVGYRIVGVLPWFDMKDWIGKNGELAIENRIAVILE